MATPDRAWPCLLEEPRVVVFAGKQDVAGWVNSGEKFGRRGDAGKTHCCRVRLKSMVIAFLPAA
jgi:hypothetical protein